MVVVYIIGGDGGVNKPSQNNIGGKKMAEKKNSYRPCSDLDIRSASLRATHERIHEMDNKGIPTVGKFGTVLKEEKAKLRAYGLHLAKKGTCEEMSWEDLKKAANDFAKSKKSDS